ncbi:translocon-associated protein subunit beta [Sitophilus oryzae]|uniref:Translocon-associated protein subunit beta n=1 Tax=Sitophilus oryzae TaxID=7048 RepID=A0A6J2XQ48_SITOR|nr:translocon-associated protein subunit beta [Sitophilus oryzae]
MIKKIVILLLATLAYCAEEKQEENLGARLLVSKQILNRYLVETKDIEVKYSIHNIGKAPAVNVQLVDNGFNTEAFEIVGGHLNTRFQRIPPESNFTHVVVVRPKRYGYFNFTSAEVTYRSSDDINAKVQVSYSSEPGEGGIVAFRDYDKKFSAHYWDWLAFALMTSPSLVIPLALWFNSKNTYEKLNKPTKKH